MGEAWWAQAPLAERVEWLLARFATTSGLFELAAEEPSPCRLCLGQGTVTKRLQSGQALVYPCSRCGGHGQDVVVRFR